MRILRSTSRRRTFAVATAMLGSARSSARTAFTGTSSRPKSSSRRGRAEGAALPPTRLAVHRAHASHPTRRARCWRSDAGQRRAASPTAGSVTDSKHPDEWVSVRALMPVELSTPASRACVMIAEAPQSRPNQPLIQPALIQPALVQSLDGSRAAHWKRYPNELARTANVGGARKVTREGHRRGKTAHWRVALRHGPSAARTARFQIFLRDKTTSRASVSVAPLGDAT